MNAPLSKAEAIVAGDVAALIRSLRSELSAGKNNIPADLRAAKSWLVWKVTTINPATGKFNKIPIYPKSGQNRHGEQGSDADLRNLGTWDNAILAFENDKNIAGVGFALLRDWGVVALDVDHCVDGDKIREDAAAYTDHTYCEVSPSGTGIRAFWRGSASDGKNHTTGFELFHAKGFVTVTGAQINNVFDMVSARRGEALPVLDAGKRDELERLSRAAGTVGKVAGGDRLKDAAERDPRLCAIRSAGLYEREMGGGKHSITCPFEDQHSDTGRPPGDGDTVYFQPNRNGHQEGIIYCAHTRASQAEGRANQAVAPLGKLNRAKIRRR